VVDVENAEKPAVAFTYGRTGPDGAMSCGPTPSQKMLLVVVRSAVMRPVPGSSETRRFSRP
jgi:hypothetical protein